MNGADELGKGKNEEETTGDTKHRSPRRNQRDHLTAIFPPCLPVSPVLIRLFSPRTLFSSSPSASTGFSATNAQCANRLSFNKRREGSTPIRPCSICSCLSSLEPRSA